MVAKTEKINDTRFKGRWKEWKDPLKLAIKNLSKIDMIIGEPPAELVEQLRSRAMQRRGILY